MFSEESPRARPSPAQDGVGVPIEKDFPSLGVAESIPVMPFEMTDVFFAGLWSLLVEEFDDPADVVRLPGDRNTQADGRGVKTASQLRPGCIGGVALLDGLFSLGHSDGKMFGLGLPGIFFIIPVPQGDPLGFRGTDGLAFRGANGSLA